MKRMGDKLTCVLAGNQARVDLSLPKEVSRLHNWWWHNIMGIQL